MKKETQKLRDLSENELHAKLLDFRKQQFHLRMKKANGVLDKTHQVAFVRKSIARIKTLMAEKTHVNQ